MLLERTPRLQPKFSVLAAQAKPTPVELDVGGKWLSTTGKDFSQLVLVGTGEEHAIDNQVAEQIELTFLIERQSDWIGPR